MYLIKLDDNLNQYTSSYKSVNEAHKKCHLSCQSKTANLKKITDKELINQSSYNGKLSKSSKKL